MGGIDKLAADVLGRPVIRWAVESVAMAPEVDRVLLVTSPERASALAREDWPARLGVRLLTGGSRRQDSVAAGVREASAEVVLVHDAARPLVSRELVARVAVAARRYGAAVPVIPAADSLKRVAEGSIVAALDRSGVQRAQTPQGARRELLAAAVEAHADGTEEFGDEAEMLARDGVRVVAVPGDPANLKVTLPGDLELLRRLVSGTRAVRHSTGHDSHPFGPGDGLRLGGIDIPEAPRLHGHSDGDVVIHAICDALLSASGLGDLGRMFPSGDPATRDIDSRELLAATLERVTGAGWRPLRADVTILAARPRLGATRLERMRGVLAGALDVPVEEVAVKAATGNLSGPEGAGRVVSAGCLLTLVAR